jgi:hypothetical protein
MRCVYPSAAQWQVANRQAQLDALVAQLAALAPERIVMESQWRVRSHGGGGAGRA